MSKPLIISFALLLATSNWAAGGESAHVVDLRTEHALEALKQTNPEHFEKIRQVIAALQEQPKIAEGDWLQVTVAARDVDLSRYILRTSYPPKQLLQFTLDDTRYIMHLVRSDLTPQVTPAK